ncbi:hypothetical protein [Ferroplasma acidiphilum]|uniref:hypothetical protein n=1 Tax=Ferroplasma acidiphilum TaxID=74969 RepID=UPI0018C8CCE0|nr:hypothetical protein [Ferroplasma acidiphilum]
MPDLISDMDPDGDPNLSFTFIRMSLMFSYDSEAYFSAWRVKLDIESLTTTIMSNFESVVPSICNT